MTCFSCITFTIAKSFNSSTTLSHAEIFLVLKFYISFRLASRMGLFYTELKGWSLTFALGIIYLSLTDTQGKYIIIREIILSDF